MAFYQQLPPAAAYRSVIAAYWVNRPGQLAAEVKGLRHRVLPDGCIDLIFRRDAGPRGMGDGGTGVLFASALIEQPLLVLSDPRTWFVGVRFQPGMSQVVLGIGAAECRDRNIPAGQIDARFVELEKRLMECRTLEEALRVLRCCVEQRVDSHAHRVAPPRVRHALALLGGQVSSVDGDLQTGAEGWLGGGVSVSGVAADLGITERSLHRELVHWTGLSPKVLARIFRMQFALAQVRSAKWPLAMVALDSGYADQPHMTREFQRLTGFTPAELLGV